MDSKNPEDPKDPKDPDLDFAKAASPRKARGRTRERGVTARIDSYKDRQCNAISLCTAMYFRLKKKERMWRRTKHL